MNKTGIYIAGHELTKEELESYRSQLQSRIARRTANGFDESNSTTRAMINEVKEYDKILKD